MASVKAYLAAGAVAGLLAGALLAVVVVGTLCLRLRLCRRSQERRGCLWRRPVSSTTRCCLGRRWGWGLPCLFRGFLRRFCGGFLSGGFLSLGLICRVFASRHAGVLGRRRLPRPRLLPNRTKRRGADHGGRPRRLAGIPKAERKMDTPALTYTCGRGQG
jgi:hypothetical protein